MKVTIGQINSTNGDLAGNVRKIVAESSPHPSSAFPSASENVHNLVHFVAACVGLPA
jgi:hypothetical protein